MSKSLGFKRTAKTFLLVMLLLFSFCLPAFAGIITGSSSGNGEETDASRKALGTAINGAVSNNNYQTTKGGYYTGDKVVTGETGLVNEKNFADLTPKAKRQLLEDMTSEADKKIDEDSKDPGPAAVSEDTKTNWLQELQQTNGIGSQLMNNILSQTKPDFVKANRIYAPFASPLGVVLGLLCIVIGAGVTLSMALDLAWMAIPLFRGFTEGDGKDGGGQNGPKWISYEARSAVQEAETGNDGGKGGNKVAVLLYFKKRVIMLVVLGVCLLYLVQGEIFTLVSWILDLVSGVIGF